MVPLYTRVFQNRYEMIEYLMYNEVKYDLGMFMEFGVFNGNSINFIATFAPIKSVYGFDGFEGLPEDWFMGGTKKAFDRHGILPKVHRNVKLVKGWFDETLPLFLNMHDEKCAFIHIDCDIYSSTKTVFSLLKDRIVVGTVIEFDEYFNTPRWQDNEYKAFQEFIKETGHRYQYIGYVNNGGQQVSIKIIE